MLTAAFPACAAGSVPMVVIHFDGRREETRFCWRSGHGLLRPHVVVTAADCQACREAEKGEESK